MIISAAEGVSFELTPLGYEFPEEQEEWSDRNWLNIRVAVKTPSGAWGGVDPCLLTGELRHLCTWLRQHSLGGSEDADVEFLEPELAFQVLSKGGSTVLLRAITRHALCAERSSAHQEEERFVDLSVSLPQLTEAADKLEEELGAYPER